MRDTSVGFLVPLRKSMEANDRKKVLPRSSCFSYDVQDVKEEVVTAVLPMQDYTMQLSNLDLLLPPINFSVFFIYPKQKNHISHVMVSALKASLSKTLVTYYPLAGEVVRNSAGEPELLCNNKGVTFVEAYADVELTDLPLWDPDHSVGNKMVPVKKHGVGVLSVQATTLRCGSLVLCCTFDHRISDAYSANMFLLHWASIASARPISFQPSFSRSFLCPRTNIYYNDSNSGSDSILDSLYAPISTFPPPSSTTTVAINRIYIVSAKDIDSMKSEARARTKLEGFSAYIWRLMGTTGAKKTCRLGMVVDGRSRLDSSTMATYFGNVLSIPYASLPSEELSEMSLPDVATVLRRMLRMADHGGHFRRLVDWVEARRPVPAVARIYCENDGDDAALVVSSGRRFPVREVDFGWGSPAFGTYHFPWDGTASYIMPMPVAMAEEGEQEDWVVYMHLVGAAGMDLLRALEVQERPKSIFRAFAING